MDLDYGHGFIPRIGSSNYKAVDRCLGQTDLFDGALHMPGSTPRSPSPPTPGCGAVKCSA
ncbi:MAG: hypothetical protein M3082_18125 [Candidatus Dormibacteraeota bacterium]|nr:hypothetical protein [Candidatus Dormibacteraeota bacterium]